ncbi:response regulator receiver protein [Chthoniobacter flavus Ellin428]|uniref:Response regulator receiver protein n=1 Tax=Chthoniobacter flavus Ellin428 TaxID=497964 RepID=B4D2V8_9BACT|nr:response regulator [Chthoniobacter flavus]EDY19069.1 response regulator receiver protein [Chthoniobacter flavus Ellin428]TCO86832.1 response regulator receiver domain-containing protein [Chthoniobacter flavus]
MSDIPTILITDDDDGHAFLIEDNLRRSGVNAPFLRFSDGQEILDFLFSRTQEPSFEPDQPYLLLLDIRMPKVDGVTVLRQIKADPKLRKLPVIILTTTEDPREVERCHDLGCNVYMQKPVSYENFAAAIGKLGLFLSLLQLPRFTPQS